MDIPFCQHFSRAFAVSSRECNTSFLRHVFFFTAWAKCHRSMAAPITTDLVKRVLQVKTCPRCRNLRFFQHTFGTHPEQPLPTGYKGIPFIVGQGDCRLGCAISGCVVRNFLGRNHEIFNPPKILRIYLHHLESRWRNSHVLVYHGPLRSYLLGVAPSTFTTV